MLCREGVRAASGRLPGRARVRRRGQHRELRMPRQKSAHLGLVFLGREGTGGITQQAAGPQRCGRVVQNGRAQRRALGHQRRRMLAQSLRLLAEHPLAGTGRVHQNLIKKCRKCRRHTRGALIQHKGVCYTHTLQIAFQHAGPRRHIFIGHQQALPAQSGGQLACFAAGRRAQVQHTFARAHAQQTRRHAGRRLLHIEHARVVVRMAARAQLRVRQQKCRVTKRRRLQTEIHRRGELLRRTAQAVYRNAAVHGARRGVQHVVPCAQQRALPRFKIFSRHRHPPSRRKSKKRPYRSANIMDAPCE